DLDDDGRLDLVLAGEDNFIVEILFNDGTAEWTHRATYRTGRSTALVLADLNADGRSDLATTQAPEGTVSVLLATGPGTFADVVTYAAGPFPQSLVAADLDGDGDEDVVVANA